VNDPHNTPFSVFYSWYCIPRHKGPDVFLLHCLGNHLVYRDHDFQPDGVTIRVKFSVTNAPLLAHLQVACSWR